MAFYRISALDIFKAHEMVQEVTDYFRMRRNTVDDVMKDMFTRSVQMAEKVDVVPSMPRINARQRNRGNTPAESVDEYYKRNLLIPFTDHIVTELEAQFSGLQTTASKLLGLVPTLLGENIDISEVVDMYEDDLPTPHLVSTELDRWKHKFTNVADKPNSLAQALKICDETMFPNIFVLLKIGCTLPVTSCECERSFSTIRRLHTYLRASMGQERLSNLALMTVHYDDPIDLEEVVNIFAQKNPRKLKLDSVLL